MHLISYPFFSALIISVTLDSHTKDSPRINTFSEADTEQYSQKYRASLWEPDNFNKLLEVIRGCQEDT